MLQFVNKLVELKPTDPEIFKRRAILLYQVKESRREPKTGSTRETEGDKERERKRQRDTERHSETQETDGNGHTH